MTDNNEEQVYPDLIKSEISDELDKILWKKEVGIVFDRQTKTSVRVHGTPQYLLRFDSMRIISGKWMSQDTGDGYTFLHGKKAQEYGQTIDAFKTYLVCKYQTRKDLVELMQTLSSDTAKYGELVYGNAELPGMYAVIGIAPYDKYSVILLFFAKATAEEDSHD